MASLLSQMRRQMNGAVVGGMRFYGAEYGLNYGVSIPTIRSIARAEVECHGIDHRFARQLYLQQVRELRLAALWMADSDEVLGELAFWAEGVVNSEVAEEAAFALFCRIEGEWVDEWLRGDDELLRYCAVMAIAKRGDAAEYIDRVEEMLDGEYHILPQAVVVMLESALRSGVSRDRVEASIASFAPTSYLRQEMAWRMDL